MLATVDSCVLAGLEARRVEVQADSANGETKFFLVGLAATSVKEARERVRSAIKNSGLDFPRKRLTVNLAPAADFRRLEQVLVVTQRIPQPPPAEPKG